MVYSSTGRGQGFRRGATRAESDDIFITFSPKMEFSAASHCTMFAWLGACSRIGPLNQHSAMHMLHVHLKQKL